MPIEQAASIMMLGLLAGMLGGLAGIGGSMFILPALHILFGPMVFGAPEGRPQVHHSYMAAAMCVNIIVALPAAIRHHHEGAVRWPLLRTLLPANLAGMAAGVLLSNRFDGGALKLVLAMFLLLYCGWNMRLIIRPRRRAASGHGRPERAGSMRLVACGASTGVLAGLLGLGGGFILVPLLQAVCNLRLRNAIATSSAALSVTALLGATLKLASLGHMDESVSDAIVLASLMAPTAVLGAVAGATWLHKLPVVTVRSVVAVLVFALVFRMAG